MRDKIISQLKAKYPGVNLSKKRMDAIADRLAPKITDEAEIDAKLDELNELMPFADIAKDDDRLRALEAKAKDKPAPAKNEPTESNEPKSEMDELKELVKGLATTVQSLAAEKQQTTIKGKLSEKLKDVPQDFYSEWTLPEKDEDIESFAEKVAAKYTALTQAVIDKGLAGSTKPVFGAASAVKGKVDADVIAYAKSKNESVNTKN